MHGFRARSMRRLARGASLSLPLILAALLAGCGGSGGGGDLGPDTLATHDLEPIAQILPGAHVTFGYAGQVQNGFQYLTTPYTTWPENAVGPHLYVIQQASVRSFVAVSFETQNGGISLPVLPDGWDGGQCQGLVFWLDEDQLTLTNPFMDYPIDQTMEASVFTEARRWWSLNDDESSRLTYAFLGRGPHTWLFWVFVRAESGTGAYDPGATRVPAGPVSVTDRVATLETTFQVPGGFVVGESNIADTNNDGIAELVSFTLGGTNAPTYIYVDQGGGSWHWVAVLQGDPAGG